MTKFKICSKCFECDKKAIGLACFCFSLGIVAGISLPLGIIAFVETLLIILMGYFCLFKW